MCVLPIIHIALCVFGALLLLVLEAIGIWHHHQRINDVW